MIDALLLHSAQRSIHVSSTVVTLVTFNEYFQLSHSKAATFAVARAAHEAANSTKHICCPPPPLPSGGGPDFDFTSWCASLITKPNRHRRSSGISTPSCCSSQNSMGRVQAAVIADGHRPCPFRTAGHPAVVPQPQRRLEDRPPAGPPRPGVQQTLHPNGPAYHPKTGLTGQCHTGPVLGRIHPRHGQPKRLQEPEQPHAAVHEGMGKQGGWRVKLCSPPLLCNGPSPWPTATAASLHVSRGSKVNDLGIKSTLA
jgi:hypothetical protein